MNPCTEEQYRLMVERYSSNPRDVTNCLMLLAEYKIRGYQDAARDMQEWINHIDRGGDSKLAGWWKLVCEFVQRHYAALAVVLVAGVIVSIFCFSSAGAPKGAWAALCCPIVAAVVFGPALLALYRGVPGRYAVLVLHLVSLVAFFFSVKSYEEADRIGLRSVNSDTTVFQQLVSVENRNRALGNGHLDILFGAAAYTLALCLAAWTQGKRK